MFLFVKPQMILFYASYIVCKASMFLFVRPQCSCLLGLNVLFS